MPSPKFSIDEAIWFGWRVTKEHLWFFVGLLLFAMALCFVPAIFAILTQEKFSLLSPIFSIGSWLLQIVVQLGMIKIALKFSDNETVGFHDLFSGFSFILYYVLGSLLYVFIVFWGLILLVIPGIVWAIQFQYFIYLIVDQKLGPIESLKKSSAITRGSKWKLLLFGLVIMGLNLLGALCLMIGLLVTIPVTMLATTFVYRKLLTTQSA